MEDALTRGLSHIYRALLKNGHENFSLTIFEYCEPEQCLEREDFYLSTEKHEYNILEKAGSPLGRNHSEKTKTKISDAAKKIDHSGRFKPGQQRPEGSG
jgi:group I intron endonuclease